MCVGGGGLSARKVFPGVMSMSWNSDLLSPTSNTPHIKQEPKIIRQMIEAAAVGALVPNFYTK